MGMPRVHLPGTACILHIHLRTSWCSGRARPGHQGRPLWLRVPNALADEGGSNGLNERSRYVSRRRARTKAEEGEKKKRSYRKKQRCPCHAARPVSAKICGGRDEGVGVNPLRQKDPSRTHFARLSRLVTFYFIFILFYFGIKSQSPVRLFGTPEKDRNIALALGLTVNISPGRWDADGHPRFPNVMAAVFFFVCVYYLRMYR
ncbi:hypothetical protein LX36DRAFT_470602 [Colletotrichum falcatum]|nr:hypothetical protein LX36DRAFT_470602 [Colletotrichum falcatum]